MAAKPLGELEIWLVTGSQHLYGEAVLERVGEHSQQIARALDAADAIPVRIVHKPPVTGAEQIHRLCLEASSKPECVGVIAWMHTFSPAKMWIAGLASLQKPLLHLHTQFNRDLHWSEPSVLERIGTWARAACGWHEAQALTVARFGDNMRLVAVTEGDKVEAQLRLGVSLNGYGVGELVDAVREAPGSTVEELVDEYEQRYALAPALRLDGERHESLRDAARIEAGLRGFLERGGFRAFTDTFEDLGGLPQLPGIAVQRLMADGYGFGAEGDWKTAALLRIAKVMSAGLHGGTSFMEDYTYHLAPEGPKVLGAHMLEVCPSIARDTPSCEIHPLSIGGRQEPVRLVFTAAGGPGVVAGLLDLGDRFRLVVNEVDVVEPDEELPRLPVARAVWKPRPDLATAAEAWLHAGAPHPTVLCRAIGTEALADFAEIAGLELLVIDADTRVPELKKELRWNEAYFHLARGA